MYIVKSRLSTKDSAGISISFYVLAYYSIPPKEDKSYYMYKVFSVSLYATYYMYMYLTSWFCSDYTVFSPQEELQSIVVTLNIDNAENLLEALAQVSQYDIHVICTCTATL